MQGVEKIAIGIPAVPLWRRHRRSSQYHLVHHKFPVIFANSPGFFLKSRIGQISTISPLPTLAPTKFPGGDFPFFLRRQAHSLPCGISGSFIKVNVTNCFIWIDLLQSVERKMYPVSVNHMPVQGRVSLMLLNPLPAFGVPIFKITVSAILNKLQIFGIVYRLVRYVKGID